MIFKFFFGPLVFLLAPRGDINIASVARAGDATIGAAGIDVCNFLDIGDIFMTNHDFISVSEYTGFNCAESIYSRVGILLINASPDTTISMTPLSPEKLFEKI